MAFYTYTGNQDPNDRTSRLILRGGDLIVNRGQWADFTAPEVTELQKRGVVLTPGQVGVPAASSQPGLYDLLSKVAVTQLASEFVALGYTEPRSGLGFTITSRNANGDPTAITYADGSTQTITYRNDGQPDTVTFTPVSGSATTLTYAYNDAGILTGAA